VQGIYGIHPIRTPSFPACPRRISLIEDLTTNLLTMGSKSN